MGYDMVGIVVSETQGVSQDADESDELARRTDVAEKWARRAIDFPLRPPDAEALRNAHRSFPTGAAAVCAVVNDVPIGMVATSVIAVSVEPPLVMICVPLASENWAQLRELPRIGLSLLAATQDNICWRLSAHGDRFAGVPWRRGPHDAVFVHDASTWLECSVDSEVAAGDHTVVLLTVEGVSADRAELPLVRRGACPTDST